MNTIMIVAIYAEYLWAAEWVDDNTICTSNQLTFMLALDCSRRYSFSDAMVHGNNLFWYTAIGSFTAVACTICERHRIAHLRAVLEHKREATPPGKAAQITWALRCLKVYERLTITTFFIVLFLVPFHIDRPKLHYPCAVLIFGLYGLAIITYMVMPLEFQGLTGKGSAEVTAWSQRRRLILPLMKLVIVLESFTFIAAMLHLLARYTTPGWCAVTGRLFGTSETFLLLLFQCQVGSFAVDDMAISRLKANSIKPKSSAWQLVLDNFF